MLNLNLSNLSRLFTIALSALMLMFGSLLLPPGSPAGIPVAHAGDEADPEGEESENGGDERRTAQPISVKTLLNMTPEEIRAIHPNIARNDNYLVIGFFPFMSGHVLHRLYRDNKFMKRVLRKMRSASTDEERKKILEMLVEENDERLRKYPDSSAIRYTGIFLDRWLDDPAEGTRQATFF